MNWNFLIRKQQQWKDKQKYFTPTTNRSGDTLNISIWLIDSFQPTLCYLLLNNLFINFKRHNYNLCICVRVVRGRFLLPQICFEFVFHCFDFELIFFLVVVLSSTWSLKCSTMTFSQPLLLLPQLLLPIDVMVTWLEWMSTTQYTPRKANATKGDRFYFSTLEWASLKLNEFIYKVEKNSFKEFARFWSVHKWEWQPKLKSEARIMSVLWRRLLML